MKTRLVIILVIIVGIALLVVGPCGWAFYHDLKQDNRYNVWAARCARDGGAVSQTKKGLFSASFECFKYGGIIDHED